MESRSFLNTSEKANVHELMDEESRLADAVVKSPTGKATGKNWFILYIRPCISEFVGTTLFIYTGVVSARQGSSVVDIALAHGLVLAALITAFGPISGAHFNPAVTLGVFLGGDLKIVLGGLYIASQICAGIFASFLAMGSHYAANEKLIELVEGNGTMLRTLSFVAANTPSQDTAVGSPALLVLTEMILTSTLVLVVLLTAVDKEYKTKTTIAPIAIGFVIAADHFAGIPITGASMNPARSVGPALVQAIVNGNLYPWKYHYVCWAGPIGGSLVAALLYRCFLASDEKRIL